MPFDAASMQATFMVIQDQCRAQAELDGIQEEQMRLGELGVRMSPPQAAELDRRKEKVARLVKVIYVM